MLTPLGFWAPSAVGAAYELIGTVMLGSISASVTFSGIPQSYKHLQLRVTSRLSGSATFGVVQAQFNSDIGSNYSIHRLLNIGNQPSSAASAGNLSQTSVRAAYVTSADHTGSAFGAGYMDILDYSSTIKNKVTRSLSGFYSASVSYQGLSLDSGAWLNTAAISSITLTPTAASFAVGSRFSLYGIKG